jgi:predicted ATPase
LDIAEEHEFQVWRAVATCLHGAALAGLGQPEEGLAQVQQGLRLYQGLNTPPVFWPNLLYIQAEVYGQAGQADQGLAVLDRALEIIGPDSEDIGSAEFYRLKGELLLALSPEHAPEAESWLQRALKVAQKLQLPMLELRAAMSLSRLWKDQGKAEQGRQLLSGAFSKMTEGFTTPDLMEAEELLR